MRRFAGKVSGWSRAQLTRLIAQYRATGRLRDRRGPPRRPFPRRYAREDIRRLAQVDALHGTLRFLVPVLEGLLGSFPFTIEAFPADNGSEFINHQVARLLNKLPIGQFTKSRARRTNDNALVESKNASVVRKPFGYAHLPARFAPESTASLSTSCPPI